MSGSLTLRCTTAELAYLAGLLGADSLIGVPDPFAGWLAHEIEDALAAARQNLANREVIAIREGGAVALDPDVARLVGPCGFSEASLMVTCTAAAGVETVRHFHLSRGLAVEQAIWYGPAPEAELIARSGPDEILQRVHEVLRLAGQGAPDAPPGELPEPALHKARKIAAESGEQPAAAFLLETGLSRETGAALAATLARPAANGALVTMVRRDDDWDVDGLAMLDGEPGLWKLRSLNRAGEAWVEVSPCAAHELMAQIEKLFERVLPAVHRLDG